MSSLLTKSKTFKQDHYITLLQYVRDKVLSLLAPGCCSLSHAMRGLPRRCRYMKNDKYRMTLMGNALILSVVGIVHYKRIYRRLANDLFPPMGIYPVPLQVTVNASEKIRKYTYSEEPNEKTAQCNLRNE
jgi:hypothetical protein